MSKAYTGIDKSGSFRVYLAVTTDMAETARKIHDTTPVVTAGLGRVLTGAGLMGLMLKNDSDKLTVIFKGDGPVKQILATSSADGNVKGYAANPYVELPLNQAGKLDVGGSLGIGELTVIKDMGLKEPYVGTIALVDGEIADDLTAYYYISEQQNTAISLGVKVDVYGCVMAAGGMIIQMLPDADEGAVDALEAMLTDLEPISTLVEEETAAAGDGQRRVIQKNALAVAPPLESACGSITRCNAAAALQRNGYIALRINAVVFGVACRSVYDCIVQCQRAGGRVEESIPSGIGTIRTGGACAVC